MPCPMEGNGRACAPGGSSPRSILWGICTWWLIRCRCTRPVAEAPAAGCGTTQATARRGCPKAVEAWAAAAAAQPGQPAPCSCLLAPAHQQVQPRDCVQVSTLYRQRKQKKRASGKDKWHLRNYTPFLPAGGHSCSCGHAVLGHAGLGKQRQADLNRQAGRQ